MIFFSFFAYNSKTLKKKRKKIERKRIFFLSHLNRRFNLGCKSSWVPVLEAHMEEITGEIVKVSHCVDGALVFHRDRHRDSNVL